MKHNFFFSLVLCCLVAAAGASSAAVDDLTDLVPAGSPLVVYVADAPDMLDQLETSPLAGLWNDPQVAAFFAPLRDELGEGRWDELVRRETGLGIDEIKTFLAGDLVFFIENLKLELEDGAEDADFSGAVLVSVGDNAEAVKAMILAQEGRLIEEHRKNGDDTTGDSIVATTQEFRGVDLRIMDITDDEYDIQTGWAVVDGVLAYASPAEALQRAVSAILDGGADSALDTGPNFATAATHVGAADSWLFIDMAPLVPVVRELAETAAATAQEAGSPFPIDPDSVVRALGVDTMQALFATFSFQEGAMAIDFGLTYSDNRGLVKLLAYGPGDAPRPAFIRSDADSFTTAAFVFGDAWSALVEIVNGINPALSAMAAMQLQSAAQSAGVELDLKRDILDNLTGEIVTIQNVSDISGTTVADLELRQDQVIALGIADRDALENAVAGLTAITGQGEELFAERSFEDHTVFALELPGTDDEGPKNEIAYVVTDTHLLISIGTPATLESTLGGMSAKSGSVWKERKVRRAVAALPKGASAIQYQDPTELGDLLFRGIAAADELNLDDDEDFRICNPKAIPDAGIVGTYFSSAINGVWKDDHQIVFRAKILPATK
ncbi:MAG: hypothetical protein V2I67_09705 [Thermoanaerobaculales bacterium]|jgi:hypothetical protein|nr:hypothetical protein [Thermoanaerobaculales bacterium]